MRRPTGTRRTALALATAALVAFGTAAATAGPATAAPAAHPHTAGVFAPYTDMSGGNEAQLDTAITGHGVRNYTAAFVIGSGCNDIWGDTLPVGADSFTDPELARAKSEGANVIISSGGAAGEPLAWTCQDQAAVNAGYQKILDSYGVSSLDFDIEGAAIADTASVARQMQAMKALQDADPGFTFSVTLPVLPTGLTADGVNIVAAAKNAGVKIGVVNIMAMDYYSGSPEMGQAAIQAARATLGQMQSVDPSYGYANVGITPMIGTNDDGSTFSPADAATVEQWAASNGIGRLAFWSENRDTACSSSATPAGVRPDASSTCSGVSQSPLAFTDAFSAF